MDNHIDHDEAQEILDAIRQIKNSPELRAEAAANPEAVVSRFNLSTVARHAVVFGIAAVLVAPARPTMWW
jgi:hypothetical protein